MNVEEEIDQLLSSLCEDCNGKGYLEYGGMAMEDDLVSKEPCTNELHERLPKAKARLIVLIDHSGLEKSSKTAPVGGNQADNLSAESAGE